jgi:CoA:oxalate CoA-transferase
MLGFPVKFSENPCRVRRPAPVLGADTDEVLKEAGLTQDAIDDLRAKGIV